MSIRSQRISLSNIIPEHRIKTNLPGAKDIKSLTSKAASSIESIPDVNALLGIDALNGKLQSYKDNADDLLKDISPAGIEQSLQGIFGNSIIGKGASIYKAVLAKGGQFLKGIKNIITRVSCLLSGIHLPSFVFGLAGYFLLDLSLSLCNPLEGFKQLMKSVSNMIRFDIDIDTEIKRGITWLDTDTAIPLSAQHAANSAVGLGLSHSLGKDTETSSVLLSYMDPVWGQTYMPNLPDTIIEQVGSGSGKEIYKQMDRIYGDWYKRQIDKVSITRGSVELPRITPLPSPVMPACQTSGLSGIERLALLQHA
jgi:hypothetical protein